MAKPTNFFEAVRYFSDLDVATEYVADLRWPDGFACPHCGGREYSYVSTRRLWKCRSCQKQSSVKVGTLFEDSALGLDKWLPAIWLAANSENAVSSHELARALGTTQKSAWFMLRRIAEAEATWVAPPTQDHVEQPEEPGPVDLPAVEPAHGSGRSALVAVAAGFFALGAVVGWLTGRAERRRKRRVRRWWQIVR
jgi:transposase-like protein